MLGSIHLALMLGAGSPVLLARAAPEPPAMPSAVRLGAKWGIVTSVHRSPARNRAVGGAPNSFHLAGRAIDIARRPGIRHAEIDAAYRRAGYRLIESLDEGDHSHFAFGLPGDTPLPSAETHKAVLTAQAPPACPINDPTSRRRPDRACEAEADAPSRLRPLAEAP